MRGLVMKKNIGMIGFVVIACVIASFSANIDAMQTREKKRKMGEKCKEVFSRLSHDEIWVIMSFLGGPDDLKDYKKLRSVAKDFANASLVCNDFYKVIFEYNPFCLYIRALEYGNIKQIEPRALHFLFLCGEHTFFRDNRDVFKNKKKTMVSVKLGKENRTRKYSRSDVKYLVKVRHLLRKICESHPAIVYISDIIQDYIDMVLKGLKPYEKFMKSNLGVSSNTPIARKIVNDRRNFLVRKYRRLTYLIVAAVQCGDDKTTKEMIGVMEDRLPGPSAKQKHASFKVLEKGMRGLEQICGEALYPLETLIRDFWPRMSHAFIREGYFQSSLESYIRLAVTYYRMQQLRELFASPQMPQLQMYPQNFREKMCDLIYEHCKDDVKFCRWIAKKFDVRTKEDRELANFIVDDNPYSCDHFSYNRWDEDYKIDDGTIEGNSTIGSGRESNGVDDDFLLDGRLFDDDYDENFFEDDRDYNDGCEFMEVQKKSPSLCDYFGGQQ